jgi:serine phosphatase RsbU (regulator of sigma subunit)
MEENDEIIGGVADCTGHGIPGALLSILSSYIISNNIKKTSNITEIIAELNYELKQRLSRGNNLFNLNDSLDLVIFKICPTKSEIEISGLKRIFIYYNHENKKHEIVSLNENRSENNLSITIHDTEVQVPLLKIKFNKEDIFYFFSDGITDQFGGLDDKKLMRKRLLSFFDSDMQNTDLKKKQFNLNLFLRKWQGITEQTDDMLLLGIKPAGANFKKLNS